METKDRISESMESQGINCDQWESKDTKGLLRSSLENGATMKILKDGVHISNASECTVSHESENSVFDLMALNTKHTINYTDLHPLPPVGVKETVELLLSLFNIKCEKWDFIDLDQFNLIEEVYFEIDKSSQSTITIKYKK